MCWERVLIFPLEDCYSSLAQKKKICSSTSSEKIFYKLFFPSTVDSSKDTIKDNFRKYKRIIQESFKGSKPLF